MSMLLMRTLSLLVLVATLLAGCSNEPEYSDQQRTCIAKLYSSFDAKQMSQCVNVCKSCMGGSMVTCTTSCNLKAAR
jgi:PBP1b-binding outer membrane lipoprotein LpoB